MKYTFLLLSLAFLSLASAQADDEIVSRFGVIRDVKYAENGCEALPDLYEYEAYLETPDGRKLCLWPLAESGMRTFKHYFNQRVRIEGEVYCGYDRMDVLSIVSFGPANP